MKKIVHIARRFVQEEWGGTEAVVFQLCRHLEQRQVAAPIFSTDMLSHPGPDWLDGVRIRRFPYQFPWLGLSPQDRHQMALKGGNPLSLSMLYHLGREKDLSLIHLHVQHRLGGIGRTISRLKGIPYIITLHGGHLTLSQEQAENMQRPFQGKWEWGKIFGAALGSRRVLDDAAAIVCVGKDEMEAIRGQYPHKLVEYIPNGVDLPFFETASPELFRTHYQMAKDEKFILCVSRLDPQKNQQLLVRAFADFEKKNPGYRLVLIGPVTVPRYFEEILLTAKEHGVEDKLLIIPGLSPFDPLLPSAYQAADLFVLPSQMEPFGMVILEAWAAGTPVIASQVGGIPGFTQNGENVLYFPSQRLDQLTHQMERLTRNSSLRKTLSAGGQQEVQNYSWTSITQKYWNLYQKL